MSKSPQGSSSASPRGGSFDYERIERFKQPSEGPPNAGWTPESDPVVGEGGWDPEDGPSAWDPKLDPSRGPNALMQLQNQSTPSLPSNPRPQRNSENVPPVPVTYDPASHLASMRLSDPVLRSNSVATNLNDPTVRSATSLSHRPTRTPHHPRHAETMPIYNSSRGDHVPDSASVYSSRTANSDYAEAGPYDTNPASDGAASVYSYDNLSSQGQYIPNAGPAAPSYASQYGFYQQPQQPHHTQTYGTQVHASPTADYNHQYYDQYYAAASDVLGISPPPNVSHSVATSRSSIPSSTSGPYISYPGPYGPAGGLDPSAPSSNLHATPSVSTMHGGTSLDTDPMRSSLTRSTSVELTTRRKMKAIDLSAPPYTKQYVDDYRQRIKTDPDPEAHFAYAKYLIEAAKKIGANSPDQRAVRKYRDTLVAESLKVIRRLATQGNTYADAQFFLANCHGTGMLGLQVDHERAYHLYLQAAKQNHPAASYRVAVCNEIGAGTRREHPRAFAFYRKAASLGDTAAMYKLGMILLTGALEQQKNPREAIGWLRRAAEQADEENPHALHELGLLHEMKDNTIVVHDDVYAKDLFTKAGQLGYIPSQFKLGQCYEYGTVACLVDPRRSIAWYTKAAEKGDPEAELALSGWYLTGSEGVLKQSDSEAYLWARRAANKGLSKAEYAVGYYAEVGIGVKQDMELAKRWYMRAAAQGNKRAMNRLTELKRLGNKKSNQGRPTRAQTRDECIIS